MELVYITEKLKTQGRAEHVNPFPDGASQVVRYSAVHETSHLGNNAVHKTMSQ